MHHIGYVIFSVTDMPWKFQFYTPRHLYDEVRHCLMGYNWMRGHAMDPFKSPQDQLSEQFVRYDSAGETRHVGFGKRWLPELHVHVGDKSPLKEFSEDSLKVWLEQYLTG